jgi:ABC-type polysaccharide/polyol phosphate export permease/tetratricopeptide (TPR) repeat protein
VTTSVVHPSVRAIIPELDVVYRRTHFSLPDLFEKTMAHLSHVDAAERGEALNKLEAIVEQVPDFALGLFTASRLYFEQGDAHRALALAERAVLADVRMLPYHLLHLALLVAVGRHDEAEKLFSRLLDDQARVTISGVHRYPQASDRFDVYLNENLPSVLIGQVVYRRELRSSDVVMQVILANEDAFAKDEHVAALRELVEICPQLAEAWFWLINGLRRTGHADEALSLSRKRLASAITDWPVQMQAGVLLGESENFIEAFKHFDAAAEINPNLPVFSEGLLTPDSKRAVVAWYRDILERVPATPDGYRKGWGNPPAQPALTRTTALNNPSLGESLHAAYIDLRDGLFYGRTWWYLARMDMRMRYRRTALGPWWNVLGVGVALVGMSVVWATIFNLNVHEFFPYLSSGYVTWILISSLMTQGCDCFTGGNAGAIQRSQNLPRSIHIFRCLAGNVLNFGHSLSIFLIGALALGIDVNWNTLLVVPGFLLLLWVGAGLIGIFGIIGARYRDLQPSISALMTVLFFITPVVFKPTMLGERAKLVDLNPLAHLMDVVRSPLLGQAPTTLSWLVTLGMAVATSALAFYLLARNRTRIVYWL